MHAAEFFYLWLSMGLLGLAHGSHLTVWPRHDELFVGAVTCPPEHQLAINVAVGLLALTMFMDAKLWDPKGYTSSHFDICLLQH